MVDIHKTAIIGEEVKLGEGVKVGAFSILEGNIEIGEGTTIENNVVIKANTNSYIKIGKNNHIFSFAVIGTEPQDNKFQGEPSNVEIGDNNTIREFCTINGGSEVGNVLAGTKNLTTIGSNCYLYINSHIAHDVFLEDNITITNYVGIAGHCKIGHHTIIGGLSGIHQFVNIGHHVMIGATCGIAHDVPHYAIVLPNENHISGANIIGLKRAGLEKQEILTIAKFYDEIIAHPEKRQEIFEKYKNLSPKIAEIVEFYNQISKRS